MPVTPQPRGSVGGATTGRPVIDLTGKRFGRLTVVRRAENRGSPPYWHVRCVCGRELEVVGGALCRRRGATRSCGCLRRSKEVVARNAASRRLDLTGQRYGRLKVLSRVRGTGLSRWRCQCRCGNTVVVPVTRLRKGDTRSCGCLRRPSMTVASARAKRGWATRWRSARRSPGAAALHEIVGILRTLRNKRAQSALAIARAALRRRRRGPSRQPDPRERLQTKRLAWIVTTLHGPAQVTAPIIAVGLDVTRRTAYRDIAYLRRRGAPIEWDRARQSFRLARPWALQEIAP